jgi:hypothetical protein
MRGNIKFMHIQSDIWGITVDVSRGDYSSIYVFDIKSMAIPYVIFTVAKLIVSLYVI